MVISLPFPQPNCCSIHQRDFSFDTDLDGNPSDCCSVCAAALALASDDSADDYEYDDPLLAFSDEVD